MNGTLKNHLLAKGLSNATVKAYHRGTLEFIAWLDGENIEPENAGNKEVTAYLDHLKKKGLSNVTRGIRLNVLKHFFDYLTEQGHRETNPARHIRIRGTEGRTLHPVLSVRELEAIHHGHAVPEPGDERANRNWFKAYRLSKQRNRTILGLMVWQGLTTAETTRLTVGDVNLREGTVYIAGSRKGAERTLELKPQQIMGLMEYQTITRPVLMKPDPSGTEPYFLPAPAAGKKTATDNDGTNIWKRLTQEVRGTNPRFTNFQQVRASVITHWLGLYNLRQVQYMAGHRYVSTTEGYMVNRIDDLRDDIDRFHPGG